jgi:hypothetical protein
MGSQSLKNIADPMRAWRVRLGDHARAAEPTKPAISLINPPSRCCRSRT